MKHYELSPELRKRLMEASDWGSIGITLDEVKQKIDERKEVKAPAKETEKAETEDEDGLDALVEQALHTCPLCLTEMEELLDEDRILEHMDSVSDVLEAISRIDENSDDSEDQLSEAIASLFLQTIDFEDDEEDKTEDK